MTVLLATVFLMVTFVTLVIALPMPSSILTSTHASHHSRNKRETITITQTRAGNASPSTRTTIEPSLAPCIPIDNPNIPTTVTLSSPSESYQLIGYTSTSTLCSGPPLPSQNFQTPSLELNSRSPVCSFKLGKPTLPTYPVKISFTLGSNVILSYSDISDPHRCFDLCNVGSFEARYPETIQITENDGVTQANNFIQVSTSTCDEVAQQETPTFLRIDNLNGANLVQMTQKNENKVVAFQVVKISQK